MEKGPAFPRMAELPVITCPRRDLDGLAADPASVLWSEIRPSSFRENVSGQDPEQATQVRCARNERELRVLFICEDREPWATFTQRDGPLWEEEVVEVFLDPIGDGECYFEFEVNPLNTVLDLVLRRSRSGYKKDFSWDCDGLRTFVRRTADGWNAELAIPFLSIGSALPRHGDIWSVNFTRIDRPKNRDRELTAWSPSLRGTFHTPDRFGKLRFV
jgi:hypothetical protein